MICMICLNYIFYITFSLIDYVDSKPKIQTMTGLNFYSIETKSDRAHGHYPGCGLVQRFESGPTAGLLSTGIWDMPARQQPHDLFLGPCPADGSPTETRKRKVLRYKSSAALCSFHQTETQRGSFFGRLKHLKTQPGRRPWLKTDDLNHSETVQQRSQGAARMDPVWLGKPKVHVVASEAFRWARKA